MGGGEITVATHFLKAGVVREAVSELHSKAVYLRRLLGMNDLQREQLLAEKIAAGHYTTFAHEVETTLQVLVEESDRLLALLESLQCEPLIYTGEGTTEEVIDRLERLLAAVPAEQRRIL